MDLISSLVLGFLQGITEWLPVSSSGQVVLSMIESMGVSPDTALSFALYLHLGTLLAVVLKFRGEVYGVLRSLPRFRSDKLTVFLIVSTLFSALTGIPAYKMMYSWFGQNREQGELITAVVGLFLILTGVILYFSRNREKTRELGDITFLDMAVVGLAQGFTVLPGISRSGVTVAALLFRGVEQENALRLSFLMSIPAVLGLISFSLLNGETGGVEIQNMMAGIIAASLFGYLTIDVLMRFARRVRFDLFCIAFGLLAVISGLLNYL